MKYILSPSILAADFKKLGEEMCQTAGKWSRLPPF